MISVTVEVDCTTAYRKAKERQQPFSLYYMHAAVTAANRIEEFRYRQVGEEVILYERIDLFTPVQNADGSYRSVRLPAIETFEDFLAVARPLIEAAKRGEGEVHNEAGQGRDILLISVNPWYRFTNVQLAIPGEPHQNIPIFIFGAKKQGIEFTIYSVFVVAIYSLSAWLITDVLPIDVASFSPLAKDDLFLCAIFGGLISGIGSGLAIRFGGAMDGIEVLAVVFAKKLSLTVGTFVMIYNVILYVICGIAFQSWILPLYSIVAYVVALKTVDYIIEGFDRSKSAMIITTKQKEICKRLSNEFENGITFYDAKGYYSNEDKTVIYFVLNRFQIGKMREIVHSIDPKAYISITEVADIFGANNNKE